MIPDPARVTALLREAAAEIVMPRWRALERHEVMAKQRGDVVTVADLEAEAFLTPRLRDLLPGSVVVGEEAAEHDAALFDLLVGSDPVWLIDPVDGTRNFADGDPAFAVMVALVRGGETLQSWILEPALERLALAERGAGTEVDGARARLTPLAPDARCDGMAGRRFLRALEAEPGLIARVRAPGCAGDDYLRLVAGELDFAVYGKLKPWDHAPGALLVAEAGGVARHLDSAPYDPTGRTLGPILSATDAGTWQRLAAVLAGVPAPG